MSMLSYKLCVQNYHCVRCESFVDGAICYDLDPTGTGLQAELREVNSQRSATVNPSVSLPTSLRGRPATSGVLTSVALPGKLVVWGVEGICHYEGLTMAKNRV